MCIFYSIWFMIFALLLIFYLIQHRNPVKSMYTFYSLFTIRRAHFPLRINGEWSFLTVHRLKFLTRYTIICWETTPNCQPGVVFQNTRPLIMKAYLVMLTRNDITEHQVFGRVRGLLKGVITALIKSLFALPTTLIKNISTCYNLTLYSTL